MSQGTCTRCGASASGNFCAACGASLGGRECPACGAAAAPGARFCNGCGSALAAGGGEAPRAAAAAEPAAGSRAPAAGGVRSSGVAGTGRDAEPSSSQIGWWAAGLMMVFLIGVLMYPILLPQEGRETSPGPTGGAAAAGAPNEPGATPFGDPRSVDLGSMTPQQAATGLYSRVMQLLSDGDTVQVQFFLPMAIAAHEQAEPLDADGLFHLSALERLAGQPEAALASAERILVELPTHLLGLYSAGVAAQDLERTEEAREYYQRLLDAWETERATDRPEYEDHARMMLDVKETAEAAVGGQ